MIREIAEIVAVEKQRLVVSTQLKTGCGGCAQQNTCGAGIISKAFSDRRAEFSVSRPAGDFHVGQQIELLLPEVALTKFSLLMYGIPILTLLLIASVLSNVAWMSEGWVIIAAFVGFGLSFKGLRSWMKKRDLQVSQLLSVQQIH